MLLKSLQLTLINLRNVSQLLSVKPSLIIRNKKYARFAPRKYVDIANKDELFDIEENVTFPQPEIQKKIKPQSKKHVAKNCQIEETKFEYSKEESSKPKSLINTKLYENEKKMTALMMGIKSKKQRKKKNQIVIEGKRLIEEAIKANLIPETIIFSRYEDIKDLPISKTSTKFYKIPYRTIQLWSTLTTTPGIMAIFEKPKSIEVSTSSLPITIVCDNIRDPRNMGSILRAAAGAGCKKVLLTKGCVDFWDSKVMRTATGAQFRVPIFGAMTWEDIINKISDNANVFIADNHINPLNPTEEDVNERLEYHYKKQKYEVLTKLNNLKVIPYYGADYSNSEVVLIVGGETEGLSMESIKLATSKNGVRINIPLNNEVDSLNAAMAIGIVIFEVKRQFSNRLELNEEVADVKII